MANPVQGDKLLATEAQACVPYTLDQNHSNPQHMQTISLPVLLLSTFILLCSFIWELHTHPERQKGRWVIGRTDEMYTSVVKINNCCCVQARFLGKEINLLVPCYKTDICLRSALCISSFELILLKNV